MLKMRAGAISGVAVGALLLLYPPLSLSVHNAGNAMLYMLLLFALLALGLRMRPEGQGFVALARRIWPLYLALFATVAVTFANQLWSGHFAFKHYDRALRLAVFPLVLWAVMFVPRQWLRWLPWSLFAAAMLLMAKAYVFTDGGVLRSGNIGFLSIIAYSDIAMLFGALCLCSLVGQPRVPAWKLAAFVLAFAAGLYTGVLNQTRGGWVAFILFAGFFLATSRWPARRKWGCVLAVVLLAGAMLAVNQPARDRLLETRSDFANATQGPARQSAVGIRLQLWGAALKLYARAPVLGIGRENYDPAIAEMVKRGEVTDVLRYLAHSHNELLFSMATLGTLGLLALLSVYLVPLWHFTRYLHHASGQARSAAHCGCVLVIGFFAFGLTDLMFFWPVLGGLYAIMLAVYVAQIERALAAGDGSQAA